MKINLRLMSVSFALKIAAFLFILLNVIFMLFLLHSYYSFLDFCLLFILYSYIDFTLNCRVCTIAQCTLWFLVLLHTFTIAKLVAMFRESFHLIWSFYGWFPFIFIQSNYNMANDYNNNKIYRRNDTKEIIT